MNYLDSVSAKKQYIQPRSCAQTMRIACTPSYQPPQATTIPQPLLHYQGRIITSDNLKKEDNYSS
jgi:hypothetical protein